ncbi:aminoacyl-tRNA hydrolase [Candidatus Falkowbacteria bacterium]|nr:aminoacyl-tRNA hydrolase [Candidatus Falkowbacteria bacterium]
MKIIIGLGNPGEKYENTRHNIGFAVVSSFKFQVSSFPDWKINKKFNSEISEGKINGEKIILLKPHTFMNNSGQAVAVATNFYKVKPADILIIHDDIDLPLGKMRVKKDGSSGGHRGIESIITALGTNNFPRLKIGVGPKERPKNFDAANFVLKKFGKGEEKTLNLIIKKATEAVAVILSDGVQEAMNKFN